MATYLMPSRNSGVRADSHATTAAPVRPSRCPSRPWEPARSTKPVSHGSTRTQRPVSQQYSHLGFPRRVSSMPSTGVGSGSPSSASACAAKARCAVGHDTPCVAATSVTERAASPIAAPIWVRSRPVMRARAGICAMASVNEARAQ